LVDGSFTKDCIGHHPTNPWTRKRKANKNF